MSEIIQYMGNKKENIGWKQSGLLHMIYVEGMLKNF